METRGRAFDPEHLDRLVEVFHQAKRLLEKQGVNQAVVLDAVARSILDLAYDGVPAHLILSEILPPMSPADAGIKGDPISFPFGP